MNEKLNIQDITNHLSLKNNVTKEDAELFITEFFNTIELGLSSDGLVTIKDFGTFKLTLIQERESIDENTQEKIVIPSHHRISFLPSQTLNSLVNKPFAHFETTLLNEGLILENIEQDNFTESSENEEEGSLEENLIIQNKKEEEKTSNIDTEVNNETTKGVDYKQITSINDRNEVEKKESTIFDETPSIEKTYPALKSDSKSKRSFLTWYIATSLIVIFIVLFAYKFYRSEDSPTKRDVEDSEIPKPIKDSVPIVNDTLIKEAVTPIDEALETVQLAPGKTLRLIALDKYGSREFWVYIYLKNKGKIKNPDVVPVGIELILPNKSEYDINPNSSQSVAKAKKLGDEEMKKFW